MKKISMIAFIFMAVVIIFAMSSCAQEKPEEAVQIALINDAMPQLVHVQGEELDLSNGLLSVKNGEETSEIAMNAEGITVTGYDKTKLGEQTVTVSYMNSSVSFTVTVVERMKAEATTSAYLVGDSFDDKHGRFKIYRNDGSDFTLAISNEKISVSGFDADKAGEQVLTATYSHEGTTYSCQFTVTVYDNDEVTVKIPNKKFYNSHDSELSLIGGKLTLKGNGGALVREVELSSPEVTLSGFDPSAVNADNSPLTQTITALYKGKNYTFDITLTYTNVSLFNDSMADYLGLNWTGSQFPEISDELGARAIELIEIYFDLSNEEKTYITEESVISVARAAFTYGMRAIDEQLEAVEGGFKIEYGALSLTAKTKAGVEAAAEVLRDTDSEIYSISELLLTLSDTFAEVPLLDNEEDTVLYFGTFAFADSETYLAMLMIFEQMLLIDREMEKIPESYGDNGLAYYANVFDTIYSEMANNGFVEGGWGQLYAMVDAWDDKVDVIDLMYEYYYSVQKNYEAIGTLICVRFPSALDTVVRELGAAMDYLSMLENGVASDSSMFMCYYYMAKNHAEEIKNSGDELTLEYYRALPVNGMLGLDASVIFYIDDMLDYLANIDGGANFYAGGLLGIEEYDKLMELYASIIYRILTDDASYSEEIFGSDVERLFNAYFELSPMRQYLFLSSLSVGYSVGNPPLAFDDSNPFYSDRICGFVNLINEYYREKFSENGVAVYNELVIAAELYAQRFFMETGISEFNDRMARVDELKKGLSTEDKVAFETYLQKLYDKYSGFRDVHKPENKPADLSAYLGEWEDEFIALQNAMTNVELAYYFNSEEIVSYSIFISAFEKAQNLYNYILTTAPDNIVDALIHFHIYGIVGEEDDGEYYGSFDYSFNTYRSVYIYYLLTVRAGGIYDAYIGSELQDFLELSNGVIWPYLWHISYSDKIPLEFDSVAVMNALKAYSALNEEEKVLFMLMECDEGYFYAARAAFVNETLTEKAASLVLKLFELDSEYLVYFFAGTEDNRKALSEDLTAIEAMYSDLTALEDIESFEDFKEIYDTCVGRCYELIEGNENSAA